MVCRAKPQFVQKLALSVIGIPHLLHVPRPVDARGGGNGGVAIAREMLCETAWLTTASIRADRAFDRLMAPTISIGSPTSAIGMPKQAPIPVNEIPMPTPSMTAPTIMTT